MMNVIYMGTPDFSVPALQLLLDSRHKVLAVVTAPDKPQGRGRKMMPSPVKIFALEKGIQVLQPEKLASADFLAEIKKLQPDIFVVVAFRILPEKLFRIPPFGAVNLHASLLPSYRGAAPINWALINGEKITGVTTFIIDKSVDTGNILLRKEVPIEDDDNVESLSKKLSQTGAALVLNTLDKLEKGEITPRPQDESGISKAPKINKETGRIDWDKSAREIRNLIRGLSPSPGAYSFLNNLMIKFFAAEIIPQNTSSPPGTIVKAKKELHIQTGDGTLNVLSLQAEGKKRLGAVQFLAGFKGKTGDRFSKYR